MPVQSEAALEAGLIATAGGWQNMAAPGLRKRNLTRYSSILKVGHASKRRKSSETFIRLTQRMANESGWNFLKAMAQLFDCSSDNIGLHLKNIFASGELVKDSVTEKNSATASDGRKSRTKCTMQYMARLPQN